MKLLIIRHADPYYPTDSLTEKGEREAEFLSKKLVNENITQIFVSPHGRAQLTAKPTAEKLGIKPVVLDWLKEFPYQLNFEYNTDYFKNMKSAWNMPPEIWTKNEELYNINDWKKSDILKDTKIVSEYKKVCENFDNLLSELGYKKDGNQFIVTKNPDNCENTIALFCHFGIGTLLISHILNMPLIPIWNSIYLPPSSVTTVYFEQHLKSRDITHPIFAGIGDTSHLYKFDEPISCSGLHTKKLV